MRNLKRILRMRWQSSAACVLGAALLLPHAARAQQVDAPGEAASARPAGDVNAANNPLTPKITVNLQDYFLPSLNRLGNRQANQGLLRGLVPSDAFGVPQLIRFTLPLVTTPNFPNGSHTGLGDLTLFDLVVIPTQSVVFGVGPAPRRAHGHEPEYRCWEMARRRRGRCRRTAIMGAVSRARHLPARLCRGLLAAQSRSSSPLSL